MHEKADMSRTILLLAAFWALAGWQSTIQGQVPHIYGSWKLDVGASEYPGPAPQSQVRTYFPADDGYLIGILVTVDAQGNASFPQFAARTDGQDYPEYGVSSLAQLQISGTPTSATYSETEIDEYTVRWVDKNEGEPFQTGTKRVSDRGRSEADYRCARSRKSGQRLHARIQQTVTCSRHGRNGPNAVALEQMRTAFELR
jgi:hypothetical protein